MVMDLVKSSKLKEAFDSQRKSSRERNIDFLLTYEEWLQIWIDSGHLHERGRFRGQYVMARFGDKGPYAIGNVKIVTAEENVSEGNKGKVVSALQREKIRQRNLNRVYKKWGHHSDESKQKMSKAQKGKKFSEEHIKNLSNSHLGRVMPEEQKKKIAASILGMKRSEETKDRLRKAWVRRKQAKTCNTALVYDSVC